MMAMVGKILYWKGCMSRLKMKSIADSTEALLGLLGVDYDTLGGEEGCCGSVLLRTGQYDAARSIAILNADRISSLGYSEIVTSCPGCFKTMSSEYPAIIGRVPFRVMHVSQFLYGRRAAIEGRLHPIRARVVYHDPCHLGRHMGVYDEPRALIRMVPGADLVEFKYNRSKALCCGAGGGVRSAFPEIAVEVARGITGAPLKETGAGIIITSCPFCNYNLKEAGGAEVIDLPEFLLRSWRGS